MVVPLAIFTPLPAVGNRALTSDRENESQDFSLAPPLLIIKPKNQHI
jgi:hypothetical protein